MIQSRKESLVETLTNLLVGFMIAILAQVVVFPLMGIVIEPTGHLTIAVIFTFISLARSYLLRRFFNYRSERKRGLNG